MGQGRTSPSLAIKHRQLPEATGAELVFQLGQTGLEGKPYQLGATTLPQGQRRCHLRSLPPLPFMGRRQRPLQVGQGHQTHQERALAHHQAVALAGDQLLQGLDGGQVGGQHQGSLRLHRLCQVHRRQLAATALLRGVGAQQTRITDPLPALNQGSAEAGGRHQRQHDADVTGELEHQQQGRERCPGTAGQHRRHAHHGVGGRFGHRQLQPASAQQLAVAVAQHRPQHQGRSKATAHKPGGIADRGGQQLGPEQQHQGQQGDAPLPPQQRFNRVVTHPQHLGEGQGKQAHRQPPQRRRHPGGQLAEPALQAGTATQGQGLQQQPGHPTGQHAQAQIEGQLQRGAHPVGRQAQDRGIPQQHLRHQQGGHGGH